MRTATSLVLGVVMALSGCGVSVPRPMKGGGDLKSARQGFTTTLVRKESDPEPPAKPPSNLFALVKYRTEHGDNYAYLSKHPADEKRRPAIIWITGGDCNSIGETAWEAAPADNDQSARAFRQEGVVMMFPSLRGGSGSPGFKEGFFGEVEDVLAAAHYLASHPSVDPDRIYLGGHSTGGTLAMLVAACDARFRAVFAFGPEEDVRGYGDSFQPYRADAKEIELRSPGRWLSSIKSRVFVFEGAEEPSNIDSLQSMAGASRNRLISFHAVRGADHFSVLLPGARLAAKKILSDTGGGATNIQFTSQEIDRLVR